MSDLYGLMASQVGYINAHATSTPVGDAIEAAAIEKLMREDGPRASRLLVSEAQSCRRGSCDSDLTEITPASARGFDCPTRGDWLLSRVCGRCRRPKAPPAISSGQRGPSRQRSPCWPSMSR